MVGCEWCPSCAILICTSPETQGCGGVLLRQVPILSVSLVTWLIAQVLKTALWAITKKRLNLRRLVESGGMPSSHSALVMALTTSVGINEGIRSSTFAVSLVMSLIVMYDAAGVRQAAGKQARILNRIVTDIYENRELHPERLKELLGHTPVEVLVGALLGILVPFCYAWGWF